MTILYDDMENIIEISFGHSVFSHIIPIYYFDLEQDIANKTFCFNDDSLL